jgi:hypothetical protein
MTPLELARTTRIPKNHPDLNWDRDFFAGSGTWLRGSLHGWGPHDDNVDADNGAVVPVFEEAWVR